MHGQQNVEQDTVWYCTEHRQRHVLCEGLLQQEMVYRLNHRLILKLCQPQPSTKEEVFQFPKTKDVKLEEVGGDSDCQ